MNTDTTHDKLDINDLPVSRDRDGAWRILRERGGVVELTQGVAITDGEIAEQVLKDPDTFSSKEAFDILGSPLPLVPIASDPPDHTRYRRLLQPFFSPRSVRPLEDSVRQQIIELIEPLSARGDCDFVAEVAAVLPTQVFLTYFGLPLELRNQFIEWKDAVIGMTDLSGAMPDHSSDGMRKAGELYAYLADQVAQRRGVPGKDVLSQLLCLDGEDALTDEEAIGLCFLFVLAGLDTVTDSLGMGMERLARHPALRQELVDNPSVIPNAVEELLRLDPPASIVPRMTTRDVTLDGKRIPAGTRITIHLALANREENRHTTPHVVDFHRSENPHASFGLGIHRCLGAHLARQELRLLYEEWHKRIPNYHVTPGTQPRVRWPHGTIGLEALHLTFGEESPT